MIKIYVPSNRRYIYIRLHNDIYQETIILKKVTFMKSARMPPNDTCMAHINVVVWIFQTLYPVFMERPRRQNYKTIPLISKSDTLITLCEILSISSF